MLLSLRHACRTQKVIMPNSARLKKVRQSMARLKTVVGERSIAYKKRMKAEVDDQAPAQVNDFTQPIQ